MKRVVADWVIQLVWFVASVFATEAVWFFLSKDAYIPAGVSALSAVVLCVVAMYLQSLNDLCKRLKVQREKLGYFLKEAEAISARANNDPPPVDEHNSWVARVEVYLTDALDASYAARFSNYNGMTFYVTNPNPGLKKSLEGRSRRLHEFIAELAQR